MASKDSHNQLMLPFVPWDAFVRQGTLTSSLPSRGATLPSGVPTDAKTRRDNVWRLLQDGRWHTTMEINAVNVGGSEGCRRLRELRALIRTGRLPGKGIEKRQIKERNQFEYRLV